MTKTKTRSPLLIFMGMAFFLFTGASTTGNTDVVAGPLLTAGTSSDESVTVDVDANVHVHEVVQPIDLRFRSAQVPAQAVPPANSWASYPNVCETFRVIQSTKQKTRKDGTKYYPLAYKRNRFKRNHRDRDRTRKLVEFVAKEMGVEYETVLAVFARHESTWNPEAIHVLNPDLDANQKAWDRHTYSVTAETELEAKLAKYPAVGEGSKKYWAAKRDLANLRLYKGNTHWHERLAFDYIIPEHTAKDGAGKKLVIPEQVMPQSRNVWAFGYGLYGHYSVGYVKNWDKEAPPWILCGDEGIIATVIHIWVARAAVIECDSGTDKNPERWGHDGGTYRGVIRRLAKGHCSDKRLGQVWRGLIKDHPEVPWDKHADFGMEKWPQYEMKKKRGKWIYKFDKDRKRIPTDRQAVLDHMVAKARKKGLLRDTPLERHYPERVPVVLPGMHPIMPVETPKGGSSTPLATP